jgi:hypothetical protein
MPLNRSCSSVTKQRTQYLSHRPQRLQRRIGKIRLFSRDEPLERKGAKGERREKKDLGNI